MAGNKNFVACEGCGAIFDKTKVRNFDQCPVCDWTVRKVTPVPGVGRVTKWWSEVDS